MGFFDSLFGGTDKSAQKKQIESNEQGRAYTDEKYQTGFDILAQLFPQSDFARNTGFQSALDLYGQTIPQQADVFQQGNMGAQSTLLAGMPQVTNAILGRPVDYSALQPTQVNVDMGWSNQQLPTFEALAKMLGGASGKAEPVKQAAGLSGKTDAAAQNALTQRKYSTVDSYGNRGSLNNAAMAGLSSMLAGNGGGFNPNVIGGAQSGHTPGWFEQFAVEHPGLLGGLASNITGIPGGSFLANALVNNYWQNNAWNSNAMGGTNLIGEQIPPRQTLNEMINESLAPDQSPYDPSQAQENQQQPSLFGNKWFDPFAFTTQPGFTGQK